jgi:hypothetical protein
MEELEQRQIEEQGVALSQSMFFIFLQLLG